MSPPTLYTYADYSSGTIPASALAAAGFKGAVRYITSPDRMNPPGKNQKHMTRAEYEDHRAHGLDTVFIFQGGTADADSGFNGGAANARLALAGLKYLGAPLDTPVFLCNDRPELPSATNWQQYLRGGRSVLGRVGQYGFRNAIDAGWDIADWHWQCGSESKLRPGVHMYQWNNGNATVAGRTCDINRVYIPILSKDNDMQWDDEVTVTSQTTPGYTERHKFSDIISDIYFKTSDDWTVNARTEEKVDHLSVAGVDAKAVADAVLAQIRTELQPLFDLANRLES